MYVCSICIELKEFFLRYRKIFAGIIAIERNDFYNISEKLGLKGEIQYRIIFFLIVYNIYQVCNIYIYIY